MELTPVRHDGRWWLPHNRWDLAEDAVAAGPVPTSVAVIVVYFEQPASLARMYAALAPALTSHPGWEVIVVDDGSPTPPPQPPATFPTTVRMLRQDDLGCRPGAARNLAAAATDADVLVFFDSDTLPEPETPTRLARWPALVPDALVVGRRHHAELGTWSPTDITEWMDGRRPPPRRSADPAWLDDGYAATGDLLRVDERAFQLVISATMSCGHRLYDDIGGFDGDRVDYGGEDWEFAARAFHAGAVLVHEPDAVAWHDELDWSDRDGRLDLRNGQAAWLASMVGEPSTRASVLLHERADVVAEIALADDAPLGASIAALTSLLAAVPDVAVHLPAVVDPRLAAHIAFDPRIRTGRPTPAAVRRARRHLAIDGPVCWDADGLRRLLDRLGPSGPGLIEVVDGSETIATATSSAATGRVRRAGETSGVTIEALFGTARLAAPEVGAQRVSADVDLSAFYGGWWTLPTHP